jgi:uncharacterized membrane protein (DUF2068 family)
MEANAASRRNDRLLPWIAAERALRTVLLVAVGIVLVTNPHLDLAHEVTRLAQKTGLNPNSNWVRKLVERVRKVGAGKDVVFGVAALALGALEGAEAYGLWRRRRWGEWLTVVATSLLLVPEIWELTKGASPLKVGALLANLLIVAYLVRRLRREPR